MDRRQVFVGSLVVLLSRCAARATQEKEQPPITEDARSPGDGTAVPIIEDVAFWGLRRIAADTVRMHVSSRMGERLDQARVESDVRTLARLGWFETVRVETEGVTDAIAGAGSPLRVRLSFYLEQHSFLTNVKYTGSRLVPRRQIEKVLADKKLTPKLGARNIACRWLPEPRLPVFLTGAPGSCCRIGLDGRGHRSLIRQTESFTDRRVWNCAGRCQELGSPYGLTTPAAAGPVLTPMALCFVCTTGLRLLAGRSARCSEAVCCTTLEAP
jgi:hypothetical protein